jgi:glycosyltransferase involved in cell wall biosynthesis
MTSSSPGKKIIVVSTWAPPMVGGAPGVLYNLLSQFPPNSYCILTSFRNISGWSGGGPWLPGEYFFYDLSRPIETSNLKAALSGRETRFRSVWYRGREFQRLSFIVAGIRLLNTVLCVCRMVQAGVRIVRKKDIRCIIGMSDSGTALISSYFISRLTNAPLILYLFDIYLGNKLTASEKLLAMIFEGRLFNRASAVIVTNEATDRLYRKRYGNKFRSTVVHNSVFPVRYETKRTPYNPREPYTIVYTGLAYWAQERSLTNLIEALSLLNNMHVQLDLYVPNPDEILKTSVVGRSNIRLLSKGETAMPAVQCAATVLFLPLAWHTGSPNLIGTASPAKLAEYLASGRPILIHAPPYAFVTQYARDNDFALVVDEENIEALAWGVRKLLYDVEFAGKLIENAKRIFYENHDARTNAKRLARIIRALPR